MIIGHRSALVCLVVLASAATACSGDDDDRTSTGDNAATGVAVTLPAEMPQERPFEPVVPLCADLPDPADSLDWSGVQFSDIAFPTRTRDALIVALEFPYVVDVWGGTGIREGWIVIGVSGGAVELQAMIDAGYPGSRVLAMPLDWTPTELQVLAGEVDVATADLQLAAPAIVSIARGQVQVQLGTITEERAATLDAFAGRRVCIDGEFG